MSTVINLIDARARVVGLPADDDVAQDLLDEQEAWLARRIGLLVGVRTETFYVGGGISFAGNFFPTDPHRTLGKLGLRRFTDSVSIVDGGVTMPADQYRLADNGASIVRSAENLTRFWTGPYVAATYTPSDELEVRAALYELAGIESQALQNPVSGLLSEQLGDYGYTRGDIRGGIEQSRSGRKAAIVEGLLPRRDQLVHLSIGRSAVLEDPVINRAEPMWP